MVKIFLAFCETQTCIIVCSHKFLVHRGFPTVITYGTLNILIQTPYPAHATVLILLDTKILTNIRSVTSRIVCIFKSSVACPYFYGFP